MDPVTALAAATAIWGGIKGAVAAGQEVQDVFAQLGAWFERAGAVYDYIDHREGRPSTYDIAKPPKSDTSWAFEIYAAKVQLRQMEAEIRHEFLYGGLCHLGLDGYKEFLQIRQDIKVQRTRDALQRQRQKKQQWNDALYAATLVGISALLIALLVFLSSL